MTALRKDNTRTSGEGRATTSARRRWKWAAGLAVAIVLVAVLVSALLLLSARSNLSDGLNQIHQAEAQLHPSAVRHSPLLAFQRTRAHVTSAHSNFQTAENRLAPLGFILPHLSWVPLVGARLAAVQPATRAAEQTTAAALPLLRGIEPLADTLGHRTGSAHLAPAALIRLLARGRPDFDHSCSLLNEAEASRRAVPASNDSTLNSALHSFDRQIPRLRVLCKSLQVLPGLLGYPHVRTYLVAYQDTLELRSTGGFIGSLGLLSIHQGKTHQRFGGSDFLTAGAPFGAHDDLNIPPPEPVAGYNQEPEWLFRDSNWSPDFPTTAQVEAYIFKADTHRDVDGVIDLTPQGAAYILQATGPVYAPEYHRWVTASNLLTLSDHYTHATLETLRIKGRYRYYGPTSGGSIDTRRKQFIGIVARLALHKLNQLTPDVWLRLGNSLATAFAHRDILLYFRDPQAQSLVHLAGADGEINHTKSDYLYVVDTNLSYNKINPWIHLKTAYDVRIRPDRWLDAHLTLSLTDDPVPVSYQALGWWGPAGGSRGGWSDYASFLRIYAPAGAQLVDQNGWTQPWTPGPAYDKTEFSGYLIVRRGTTRTVTLHYVIPPNVFVPTGGKQYRLLVQHQPGTQPDETTVHVQWGSNQQFSAAVHHPLVDWRTSVKIPYHPFHAVPLSKQPAPVVAANHWIEPHAFLGAP